MTIEISGRNYEVTDRIRKLITTKLEKVQKFFTDIIEIRCVLNVEKYRNICEIFIVGKDYDVKSVQEASSMEDAIVSTIDHLKRQAQKSRKKITDHHRRTKEPAPQKKRGARLAVEIGEGMNVADELRSRSRRREGSDGGNEPRIIRARRSAVRSMTVEHAATLLDRSKDEFIVFRDADNDKVAVLYKRRDNSFGLIPT